MLITGATGLLGSAICKHAADYFDLFGVARNCTSLPADCVAVWLDLVNRNELIRALGEACPHVIVHCAAMTDVDLCETEPQATRDLHVDASRTLAEWAEEHGSRLIYVSTDSVFDGCAGNYSELDLPAPLNEYARTKLAGEITVRDANPSALILRANFYGLGGKGHSLVQWVLSALESGQVVRAFADVRFNPLPVRLLAEILVDLISRSAAGIFHAGASDSCSKYDFTCHLAEILGFEPERVIPISVCEHRFRARRPKNTTLNVRKISEFFGRQMPKVFDGLLLFRKEVEGEHSGGSNSKPHILTEASYKR
ncbi:MAG TPA: SDR family oxidoreductase [Candidatus Acidoferrales bacterium]|nr:SDR family oxidoreductase [Candidatus Acidoferrales bacterium]